MWNDKEGAAGGEGLTISLSSPLQSLFQTTGLALFLSALLLLGKTGLFLGTIEISPGSSPSVQPDEQKSKQNAFVWLFAERLD